MRLALTATTVLVLVATARAADDPKTILKRAIEAQGGPEAVKALAGACWYRREGAIYVDLPGSEKQIKVLMTDEYWGDEKGREREVGTARVGARTIKFTSAFDGKAGWRKVNGTLEKFSAEKVKAELLNNYHDRVRLLHGLLEDRAFTLEALGETKVAGKPALGVRVKRKGHGDSSLYFDKATGLLVRHSYTRRDYSDEGVKDQAVHMDLSNYRELALGTAEEQTLKASGVKPGEKALLAYLKGRVPSADVEKRVKALVAKLESDGRDAREKAAAGLVELGAAAIPALEAARENKNAEAASLADRCLSRINPARQKAALLAAVRLAAARQVDGACGLLLELLPGADEGLTREVCDALYALANKGGKPDPGLVGALKDKRPAVRAAAEKVLGKDGGKFAALPGRRVYPRGVKQATTYALYVGEKKLMDIEVKEVSFFNRLADELFKKPFSGVSASQWANIL